MFMKIMRIAAFIVFRSKHQIIEIKWVITTAGSGQQKKGGAKIEVSLAMLLKTNIENLSVYCLLAMLMKTKDV
jgi:hypothetical protein